MAKAGTLKRREEMAHLKRENGSTVFYHSAGGQPYHGAESLRRMDDPSKRTKVKASKKRKAKTGPTAKQLARRAHIQDVKDFREACYRPELFNWGSLLASPAGLRDAKKINEDRTEASLKRQDAADDVHRALTEPDGSASDTVSSRFARPDMGARTD